MMNNIYVFLHDPLNQALLSIPLSIMGNLSTDAVKAIYARLHEKERIEQLEDTLFSSFLKALEIHQTRYDIVARRQSERLHDLAQERKQEFLHALKSFEGLEGYTVPARLNDKQVQQMFIDAFIQVFEANISDKHLDLVKAIVRDTCIYYRDAFFQEISQEEQLWIVFRESFKIDSIVEFVKDIQQRLPSREEFESIRSHILATETTPEDMDNLKRRYLDYLERKFSSIELTGVSPRIHGQDIAFDLEEIFIPLGIKTSEFRMAASTYTREEKLRHLFDKQESLIGDKVKLLQHLEHYPRITLLGDPGGGKTTLLKYITLLICRFQRNSSFLPFYIPIFVGISEYARLLKLNPSKRLFDFLLNDYDKQYSRLFQWAFDNGQVLLVLDGLDEVLDTSQRLKVVNEVQDIVARMPENRYIISSRIIGYEEARLGSKFAHFTIQPFNREQIKAFCHSWYKAVTKNRPAELSQANGDSEKLFNAIVSKKEIENLACNPLLITLIANIHFKGQSLPHNRVQLYDVATETLLQYWVQLRISDESQLKDKDDVIEILSPIAFYIHETSPEGLIEEKDFYAQCKKTFQREEYDLNEREIKQEIKDLIRFLREQSGFFHEKGIDESTGTRFFGFLHQTFQEYLAAIEIVNQWKEQTINFAHLVANPRWSESLRLAAGVLKGEKGRAGKRNVTQFVEEILFNSEVESSYRHRGLFLVALILVDDIELLPRVQEEFLNIFIDAWSRVIDQELLKEFTHHANLLLRSKQNETLWGRIEFVLKQDKHPLQKYLPKILADNVIYRREAKEYFVALLRARNVHVVENAWTCLRDYMVGIDQYFYYAVSYYGDPLYAYQEEDPTPSVERLVSYSEFLALIDTLNADTFSRLLPIIKKTLDCYTFIFFSNGWACSAQDFITQMEPHQSPRVLTAFLAALEDQSDLLKYSNELMKILQNVEFIDELFEDFAKRIAARIPEAS